MRKRKKFRRIRHVGGYQCGGRREQRQSGQRAAADAADAADAEQQGIPVFRHKLSPTGDIADAARRCLSPHASETTKGRAIEAIRLRDVGIIYSRSTLEACEGGADGRRHSGSSAIAGGTSHRLSIVSIKRQAARPRARGAFALFSTRWPSRSSSRRTISVRIWR